MRNIIGRIINAAIYKEANKYYVSVIVEEVEIQKEKINQERFSAKGNRNVRTVLINSDGQMRTVKDIVFMQGTWMI